MRLNHYITEQSVVLNLRSGTKKEAIAELAEALRPSPDMADYQEFLKATFAREAEATTGIGHGVAIPHARTDSVSDFVAAVGVSVGGVDFDAVDGRPVHLLILMGIPMRQVKAYLKLLAHLSLLFKQNDFIQQVVSAKDAQAVLEAFRSHEEDEQ